MRDTSNSSANPHTRDGEGKLNRRYNSKKYLRGGLAKTYITLKGMDSGREGEI